MSFIEALEARNIEGLRCHPKADLHIHSVGGGDRAFLRRNTGKDIAPVSHVLSSMAEMHDWIAQNIGNIFRGPAGRRLAMEAAFVQARRDGVTRIELGDDVWAITFFQGDAAAMWSMLADAKSRAAPEIEWIPQLGISRHCPIDAIMKWISPLLELGKFASLDLSGDEFAQPIEVFAPVYRRAKEAGLRLKAHVGEWGTADDVWRAIDVLELDEVQHGIAAASSPLVMRQLEKLNVRLNVCPTSNLKLGRVDRMEDHPIRILVDAGVRVSINTDDPLIFGSSLSQEFLALYEAGVLSAAELDQIRIDALN